MDMPLGWGDGWRDGRIAVARSFDELEVDGIGARGGSRGVLALYRGVCIQCGHALFCGMAACGSWSHERVAYPLVGDGLGEALRRDDCEPSHCKRVAGSGVAFRAGCGFGVGYLSRRYGMEEACGMSEDTHRPVIVAGIVACAFFYFLLFAQFALLKRIEFLDSDKLFLQPAMFLMGMGGVVGALLAGWRFRMVSAGKWLGIGFFGCSFFALIAMWANVVQLYLGIALGVGVFLGMLTVAIVPLLPVLVRRGRIGLYSGVGVGVAFFLSNAPFIFEADSRVQCCLAAIACGIGALLALGIGDLEFRPGSISSARKAPVWFYWGVVAVLFTLVWLDSAVFYAIQETASLKASSWGEPRQLWTNAFAHAALAIVSGLLLDFGKLRSTLGGALALLVAGSMCLRIGYGDSVGLGGFLYVCGVSLYSTALIAFCATWGEGFWSVAKRAGALFALAGWVASGMGIGMARDLQEVPVAFLCVASVFAGSVLLLLGRAKGVEKAA